MNKGKKDEPVPPLDRRRFCNHLLWTSAGLALAAGDIARANGQKAAPRNLLAYPPMKIEGAERVLPGSFLYFDYPRTGDPSILLRSKEGEYYAYSRKCAHLGCSVEFDDQARCLKCPCHRGAYDARTGYVMFGPPPRPLDHIILQLRAGGEVWAIGRSLSGDLNAD
jgi:nitrite reductase/ring-hydroxylating ferredoxin subunit